MDDSNTHVAMSMAMHKGDAPIVMGQLGQSLDGRIATVIGESKYINGAYALDHLHELRASVDAVVVGVGTIVADDPLLTVRRVSGRSPARVVLDPSGRADPDAHCFQDDGARRVVVRRTGVAAPLAPGVEVVALEAEAAFAPAGILAALRASGFARILVEGGARTLSAFLEAGCIDVVHIFVSPVILGSGRNGFELPPVERIAEAMRPAATRVHVFPDGDVLFECHLSQSHAERGKPWHTGISKSRRLGSTRRRLDGSTGSSRSWFFSSSRPGS